MEILSCTGSNFAELLADATVNQARYLFCFNTIIKELEDKETNLKEAQDGINKAHSFFMLLELTRYVGCSGFGMLLLLPTSLTVIISIFYS